MTIERRSITGTITESGGKVGGITAPVYDGSPGTQYELFEGVVERFSKDAFNEHLQTNPDVVGLFNHDSNIVLGRTPNTLRLRSTEKGLAYEIDLPDTQAGRDIRTSIARGDVKGSSFAFVPTDVEWTRDGNTDVRLIRSAKLYDVSVVTTPAYGSATAGLRSADERKAIENEREEYRARIATEKWTERIKLLSTR